MKKIPNGTHRWTVQAFKNAEPIMAHNFDMNKYAVAPETYPPLVHAPQQKQEIRNEVNHIGSFFSPRDRFWREAGHTTSSSG